MCSLRRRLSRLSRSGWLATPVTHSTSPAGRPVVQGWRDAPAFWPDRGRPLHHGECDARFSRTIGLPVRDSRRSSSSHAQLSDSRWSAPLRPREGAFVGARSARRGRCGDEASVQGAARPVSGATSWTFGRPDEYERCWNRSEGGDKSSIYMVS
jgi:hypothetical protein